jgi:hypothetical protein
MQSIVFALVLTTALLAPSVALAQTDEQAVRARVEEFLEKLGNRDVDAVRAMLSFKAAIIVVRQQQEGGFAPSYQTGEEFIAQLEKNAKRTKIQGAAYERARNRGQRFTGIPPRGFHGRSGWESDVVGCRSLHASQGDDGLAHRGRGVHIDSRALTVRRVFAGGSPLNEPGTVRDAVGHSWLSLT